MHVKLRMNLRRPRRKPKYSLATDSEQVPRGKGEKNRCERSEIVPEIMCLQGVKAGSSLKTISNFEFRISERRGRAQARIYSIRNPQSLIRNQSLVMTR